MKLLQIVILRVLNLVVRHSELPQCDVTAKGIYGL